MNTKLNINIHTSGTVDIFIDSISLLIIILCLF